MPQVTISIVSTNNCAGYCYSWPVLDKITSDVHSSTPGYLHGGIPDTTNCRSDLELWLPVQWFGRTLVRTAPSAIGVRLLLRGRLTTAAWPKNHHSALVHQLVSAPVHQLVNITDNGRLVLAGHPREDGIPVNQTGYRSGARAGRVCS